jgi:tetratricopeptide (TPR) repeat protein
MPFPRAVELRTSTLSVATTRGLFLLLLFLTAAALGHAADGNSSAKYQQAVAEKQTSRRIVALEEFVSANPGDPLGADAMELLVWNYKQIGNQQKASSWAQKLVDVAPDNPVGLAVLADSARYHEGSTLDQNMANSLSLAKHGLRQIDYLKPPEGISAREFSDMQSATRAWLNGAAGFAYVHLRDYVTARVYLRKAATLQPENPQYVYELALADLTGKQPESQEGFTNLAKAVNLTQGTPAGTQIAQFAANRYREAGGSDKAWGQYLASTAVPGRSAVVASSTPPSTTPAVVASNQPSGRPESQLPESSKPERTPSAPRQPATAEKAPAEPRINKHVSEEQIEASLTPPPLPPTQTAPKPVAHPGAPVSIGILLQAAINNKENRRAVTYALSDLVRHLGENDEAFILSFSHDLVFEQDLTSNYDLLRDAVDAVKPESGAALLDAVGFASGHLNRIARKNNNRILLVISDGRDANSKSSPYEVTGAIDSSGVKIDCIGFGIGESESKSRLQALAARTGGRAEFVFDSAAFRTATRDIARNIGIDFPQ